MIMPKVPLKPKKKEEKEKAAIVNAKHFYLYLYNPSIIRPMWRR